MITSKVLLPLLGVSAALLMTACATAPEPLPEKISGPSEFIDDSVKELYRNVDKVYTTEYFALGIPTGWKVISFNNEPLASAISVEKADHSSLVTVRVTKAQGQTIEQSCDLALQGFQANGIVTGEDALNLSFGTCTITGKDDGDKPVTLWLRQYDDDHSAYSITFTGDVSTAAELLSYLVGNEKLMQLMVQPL
ncbi:MAG: hypothetical protein H9847_03585 [Candidatus Anaerobiospirillum pullicola]|uniref:Lipoprotein n=1 Tax=Candidatus Anaerobiospirillum pullicola TaxID=2838451 RepID=A0A948TFH6_9GAMM|nr:hypothetical protein [Candidatus Anaerobiospirillum pullicola]